MDTSGAAPRTRSAYAALAARSVPVEPPPPPTFLIASGAHPPIHGAPRQPTRIVASAAQLVVLRKLYDHAGDDATKAEIDEVALETGLCVSDLFLSSSVGSVHGTMDVDGLTGSPSGYASGSRGNARAGSAGRGGRPLAPGC